MNTIFKYNANTKYSTKDLKGGYNSNNFSLLDVYLDEKGSSLKIQLPDIFKDHHIVAQASPTKVGYHEWPLSLALWRKFYNSHGKYKPELNEYFNMYRCQLSFAMFCVTSALGIFWQHLNHPNLLVRCYMIWAFLYHMKMVSARSKMLTLKVHITVSAGMRGHTSIYFLLLRSRQGQAWLVIQRLQWMLNKYLRARSRH